MDFRIKLALLVGGAVLAFKGFQEWRLTQNSQAEATYVELAELEAGLEPDNAHLVIGPHWMVSEGCVFNYETSTFSDELTPSSRLNHAYFPLISETHPYNVAIDHLYATYGDLNAVPDDQWPAFENFRVLLKTTAYPTYGDLPEYWVQAEGVQGLVINRVKQLDGEETALLLESYPDVDLEQLLVLEAGRKPIGSVVGYAMMGGGAVLALGGIALFLPLAARRRSRASEPRTLHPDPPAGNTPGA